MARRGAGLVRRICGIARSWRWWGASIFDLPGGDLLLGAGMGGGASRFERMLLGCRRCPGDPAADRLEFCGQSAADRDSGQCRLDLPPLPCLGSHGNRGAIPGDFLLDKHTRVQQSIDQFDRVGLS